MAIRLMRSNPIRLGANTITQKFKHLLVIDFEATCLKDIAIGQPEIIEFPCIALNTNNWKIDNTFHKYVKPRVNPILSSHCTDLTGIMQETIDDEQHFPVVFKQFCEWLEINGFVENNDSSAFITCGDWDLKAMLPSQCALDKLTIPHYLTQWINLKNTYCDATKYYPRSLNDMIKRLKITPCGRPHSGLYDTLNMIKIITELAKNYNAQFDVK